MIKKYLTLPNFIIVLSIGMIAYNGFFLFVYTASQILTQKEPPAEPGSQFAHFKPYLKGQTHIGFLTDKNMSPEHNDGFFSQAQYILAPIIVKLNDPQYQFSILDYTDLKHILYTMHILKAKRVTHNDYGQALIQRRIHSP